MKVKVSNYGIPAGVYRTRYKGGETITTEFGEAYKMTWEVIGGEFDGKTVSRLVNPDSTSTKANIVKFIAALADVTAKEGVNLDDDEYVGCEYEILVGVKDSGYSHVEKIIKRLSVGEQTQGEMEGDMSDRF